MNRPIFPPLPQFSDNKVDIEGDIGITEMAEVFDVTLRTLRFYEEKGLLNPRRSARHRFYSAKDRRVMMIIHTCRELGIAILDIKAMLAELEQCAGEQEANMVLARFIQERINEIDTLTAAMAAQRASANAMMATLGIGPKDLH